MAVQCSMQSVLCQKTHQAQTISALAVKGGRRMYGELQSFKRPVAQRIAAAMGAELEEIFVELR